MTSIYCVCGSYLGRWTPATHDQPGEANCYNAVYDQDGIPYCDDDCLRTVHPHLCAGCKDEAVEIKGNYCEACLTSEPFSWVDLDDYVRMRTLSAMSGEIAAIQREMKAIADASDELARIERVL